MDLHVSKKARNLKYQLANINLPLVKNYLQNSSLKFTKNLFVTFVSERSSCVKKCLGDNHYQMVFWS